MMSTCFMFFEASLIGLAIAAPVGPIALICMRKTLEIGLKGALLVGLGAALADAVYGSIAALGLSTVTNHLFAHAAWIKFIGGFFLLYLAFKELRSVNIARDSTTKSTNDFKLIIEIFFLTITNPLTIMSFIGVFASINIGATGIHNSIIMVFGIFAGSMVWWFILGNIILRIKNYLPDIWLLRIKYLSALILGGFGFASLKALAPLLSF